MEMSLNSGDNTVRGVGIPILECVSLCKLRTILGTMISGNSMSKTVRVQDLAALENRFHDRFQSAQHADGCEQASTVIWRGMSFSEAIRKANGTGNSEARPSFRWRVPATAACSSVDLWGVACAPRQNFLPSNRP